MEQQADEESQSCEYSPDVVYLKPGQECPNCHFAELQVDESGELKCPVCGYGTAKPCT
jgi:hypothetical protein